jgi:hypothetical protein
LVAAVSSAIACTSSTCSPQKSAICEKLSEVFSTSQEAVACGIRGCAMSFSTNNKGRPTEGAASVAPLWCVVHSPAVQAVHPQTISFGVTMVIAGIGTM